MIRDFHQIASLSYLLPSQSSSIAYIIINFPDIPPLFLYILPYIKKQPNYEKKKFQLFAIAIKNYSIQLPIFKQISNIFIFLHF